MVDENSKMGLTSDLWHDDLTMRKQLPIVLLSRPIVL